MKPGARSTRARAFVETFIICAGMIALILLSIVPSMAGLKEDLEAVAKKHDGTAAEITRTMEVKNPELQLSFDCHVMGEVGYLTITNIDSWKSEDLWSDLKILREKGVKMLVVFLNSPGGSAYQGMSIADELRRFREVSGIEIHMEGRGLIASAAIPIFLMGDKRVCTKNTMFLIHPASIIKGGFFISREELKDLKSQTKMMTLIEDMYVSIVVDRTNLADEDIRDMMEEDTWFDAAQALEWGFVHEVE